MDADELLTSYDECRLCPHACGVNRNAGQRGRCGVTSQLKVARAMLHEWEEPPISGIRGSGAVFFSGCTLHCSICQNAAISDGRAGKDITVERLAQIFLELQEQGAHNINLVTPTHYVPSIIVALEEARSQGLHLPIVYNTSGYESVETLKLLRSYVDIYLTDFKYWDDALAKSISKVPDYREVAQAALDEMVAQTTPYTLQRPPLPMLGDDDPAGSDTNLLVRGTVVRLLLLPGQVEDAKKVAAYVAQRYGDQVCLSLMSQYTPMEAAVQSGKVTGVLTRPVTASEYDELVDYALECGMERSFMQEGSAASESFIPEFDYRGV